MFWRASSQEKPLAQPSSPNFTVRKAIMADIPAILSLINGYAAKEIIHLINDELFDIF